jgi:putative membrane protein insertion efficiency factor
MVWIRRYPSPYDDPYGYGYGRRWGRPRGGNSCLRDACLLDIGCCAGEALDGNCLVAGLLLGPQLLATVGKTAVAPDRSGKAGRTTRAMLAAIRMYQRDISAHRAPCCRFTPSCSQYTAESIQTHGPVRGVWLGLRRLTRCRPGGRRGYDPVPAV